VGTPNTDDDTACHFLLSAYMLKLLTYDVITFYLIMVVLGAWNDE